MNHVFVFFEKSIWKSIYFRLDIILEANETNEYFNTVKTTSQE